jgi:hypothetical protein
VDEPPTLGELGRRLDRAERACELRAADHISKDLYVQQIDTLLGDIADVRAEVVKFRAELVAGRRWVIAAVVVPVVSILVGIVGVIS